jgi:hypothetical protein
MTGETTGALAFVIAAFATIFCTAVNCYTARIAYPLWRQVDPASFGAFHREYLRLLAPVITLPHIVMFFASAALLRWRPACVSLPQAAALFALDAAVVALSAFWAGPIHSRFERTGLLDQTGISTLIRISVLRSVLMLAASGLVSSIILQAIRS